LKSKSIQDVVVLFAVIFVLLCVGCFLLSVHFLLVSVFPELAEHTLIICIVSLASVAFGGTVSLPDANVSHGYRGIFLGAFLIVVYALFAGFGFGASYPLWYSLIFVTFGVVGTAFFIGNFAAIGIFFGKMAEWRRNNSILSKDYLRDQVTEFDSRLKRSGISISLLLFCFVVICIVVFISAAGVNSIFYWFGPLFIWFAAVLYLFTRLLRRIKVLFIEGHKIDEGSIIKPFLYGTIISFVLLLLVTLLAADTSPLHYSKIYNLATELVDFSIEPRQRPAESSSDYNESAPSEGIDDESIEVQEVTIPTGFPPIDKQAVWNVIRYILIGMAAAGIVFYVLVTLWRRREVTEDFARSARVRYLSRISRSLRLMMLRMMRMWRYIALNFRSLLQRRDKNRELSSTSEMQQLKKIRPDSFVKRIEMNTILRFYKRLIDWGEKRGVSYRSSFTAGELVALLSALRPEKAGVFERVENTFEAAFYSPVRLGRDRIRAYVHDVKDITGR
jgi:hypothetical protein